MLASNQQITLRQLQILIILSSLGTGVIILPRRVAAYGGTSGWVIVVGLTLMALAIGVLISTAVKKSQGQPFIQFVSNTLTRPVAYIIGLVLWLKLVFSAGLELQVFLQITQYVMLPKTPLWAVGAAILLVCTYAAAKGMETRARVAEVLLGVMALPFIFLVALAFFDIDFGHLRPVFSNRPQEMGQGLLGLGFIFTGLECLLLVAPFVKKEKPLAKAVAHAILFAGGVILLITVLTLAKFGPAITSEPWPVLRMMDMINIPGSFIERQEVLIFSFWIITAFAIGNTFIFFGGRLLKEMFFKKASAGASGSGNKNGAGSFKWGVCITALGVLAVALFPWAAPYKILDHMAMTLGLFFLVLLPILLIVFSRKGKGEGIFQKIYPMLLLAPLLLTTGCWDRVELENRAFAVAIAVDKADGVDQGYTVSLSLPILKKDEKDAEDLHHVKTASANTLAEAFKNLDAISDKTIYYGQAKLLVLGQQLLADEAMAQEVIHSIKNKPDIDLRMHVLSTPGRAQDILEQKPPGETLPGLYVADIYRNKSKLAGTSFSLDLERLYQRYQKGAVIPAIKYAQDQDTPLKLSGAMIVKEGAVTPLDKQQLKDFLWGVDQGNKGAIITLEKTKDAAAPGHNQTYRSFTVEDHQVSTQFLTMAFSAKELSTKALSTKEYPLPQVIKNVKVKIASQEMDHLTQADKEEIAKKIHKDLSQSVITLMHQAQVDGYDWEEALRRKNKQAHGLLQPQWGQVYPHLPVLIKVDVNGMLQVH